MNKRPAQPGIACPACNHPRMRAMRTEHANNYVRRRRICTACGVRVTTVEKVPGTNIAWKDALIGHLRETAAMVSRATGTPVTIFTTQHEGEAPNAKETTH